ncbi:hypothetical protein FXO38_21980 [Capsicum annuum]|nr:hypothetical protein FXO38_21980 [Capsicum annuum]KAF3655932.1 hypothetical protein FXO37_15681 [Capsicum annuum]
MNRTRILDFKNKAPPSGHIVSQSPSHIYQSKTVKKRRYIPQLRTLRGHRLRVGSLDWNGGHILTTGGMDSMIINNDVRSPDGYTLATAAADETLRLWNVFGNPEENKLC